MGTRLVFFRRTAQEMATQPGEVFFDIDGRSVGRLMGTDCFVEVPEGQHHIRMYKSNPYGVFMGYADVMVNLRYNENLLVRYTPPAFANQPGHIMVYDYDPAAADSMAWETDSRIAARQAQQFAAAERNRRETNSAIKWGIVLAVIGAVGFVLFWLFYFIFMMALL